MSASENHIIFFDGVCNLCNGFVDWLIRRDSKKFLRYAPLQGQTASQRLPEKDLTDLKSVIYFHHGRFFSQSDAVLMILWDLGGIWRWTRVLWIIPRAIRDWVYLWVAQNRYLWFGTRETCRLPTPEEKALFLP